jgi:hypothetical protein
MGFASSWLGSGALFPPLIVEAPDKGTGIVIAVPAFDELSITEMLDSLLLCRKPSCKVEVIIIINASAGASEQSLLNNLKAFRDTNDWKRNHPECFFRIYAINLGQPAIKGWGVGIARKAGMDEAVRRFNEIDRTDGLIVNLDADCTVQDNYLLTLESELLNKKERKACSIYFEHSVSGERYNKHVYASACQYELHLRYYLQALAFTGFPNVFHTVGSSIAVNCMAYIKAGGMNRRQAGEDFYFVQKLIPAGGYFSLNSTTVYPSPRASSRVPFGTGAAVGKMVAKKDTILLTYNPLAFNDLRDFFAMVERLYNCNEDKLSELYDSIPDSIKLFLDGIDWILKVSEIKRNTSGLQSFKKRFFDWFNMFRVVKYLNFSHRIFFEKIPVSEAAQNVLINKGIAPGEKNPEDLLAIFRNLERDS